MSDPVWQMVMQAHQQNELDDLWNAVGRNDEGDVHTALFSLRSLRGAGVDPINALNKKREGWALVHLAAEVGSPEVMIALLNAGAEPDAVGGTDRRTALQCALLAGKEAMATVLLAAGASASRVDTDGSGAAHYAAHSGKVALVGLLRQARVSLRLGDKNGDTPLHVAAELAKVGFLKALLAAGVDADAANSSGWTALHKAATNGYVVVVKALLDGGASVNATNASGWTPLHSAAKNGHEDVVKALLQRGAETTLRNKQGKTAYELAASSEARKLLKPAAEAVKSAAPKREAKSGGGAPGPVGSAASGTPTGGAPSSSKPAPGVDAALSNWLARVGVADTVLPVCGALGLASLADVRHVREADLASLSVPPVARRKFIEAASELPAQGAATQTAQPKGRGAKGGAAFAPRPFPNYATAGAAAFDGHAEQLAASYMRWLGYADAATNGGVHVPDRGIDVVARGAVAQVKANFRGAVKRPALAQLVGDASVPRYSACDLLFFAVSYGQDALDYAMQQKARPLSLFAFDAGGGISAVNAHARQLLAQAR